MIELCAGLLTERRMVDHTNCDVLVVAMDAVIKAIPGQVKMMCRFYSVSNENKKHIKLRKDVKQRIYQLAKKYHATASAFIDAIITIFFRATLASLRKNSFDKYVEVHQNYTKYIQRNSRKELNINRTKQLEVKRRKLQLKKDEIEMRHHNYMVEFKKYMEQFGGIDSWIDKNIYLMIHAKPLKDSIGKPTDLDLPKEQNPGTVHIVRIWKRGRGYNMTVLSSHDSYGEDAPSLESGTVYRLYDIYRNIDWKTLKTV